MKPRGARLETPWGEAPDQAPQHNPVDWRDVAPS
jgi:hypothetical protein